MDISALGTAGVAAITILCYLIGSIVKMTKLDNKWIPVICASVGTVLGILAFQFGLPEFPAADYITAAAIGAVSGWAATGINQTGKQLTSN